MFTITEAESSSVGQQTISVILAASHKKSSAGNIDAACAISPHVNVSPVVSSIGSS